MMDLNWLSLLGLSVGLAMDAFAVAVAAGMAIDDVTPRHVFRLAFHFGLFQFLMPIAGWFIGEPCGSVRQRLRQMAGVCVAGLRGRQDAVGGPRKEEPPQNRRPVNDPTRGLNLLTLSVATSLDALAVGMSMAFLGVSVWFPSAVIGVVTATLTTIGITFGSRIGSRWGHWADIAGGVVLILLGFKVLLGG